MTSLVLDAWMCSAIEHAKEVQNNVALDRLILIKIDQQRLYYIVKNAVSSIYPVSTSRNGVGNQMGSYKTPLGVHSIAEKIGQTCQVGEILRGRKATGVIAEIKHTQQIDKEDTITSRILWLRGLEAGINQGGEVDSFQRYIYIHGTAAEGMIGQPASIGCIRMKNADIVDLYSLTKMDDTVVIVE